ncbi:MAG: rod shape-determining protein RodA [Candidatus Omnitrophota bacterium]
MRNKFFILAVFGLVLLSLINLYTISKISQIQYIKQVFFRQALWMIISFICMFGASKFPYRKLKLFTVPLFIFVCILLIFVSVFGATRLGAQRWIKLWWLNFQPSELAKVSVVLLLAHYFSKKNIFYVKQNANQFGIFKALILPFILILIPVGFILKQPDLGTALVLIFIFISMLFIVGINKKFIIFFILASLLLAPFFWNSLKPYQKDRILVFINPNLDPLGAGYTIIQSKIAVGSGRIFGKGLVDATQSRLRFLPEAHTDFIFASFCEKWGFIGVLILFSLYYLLIYQTLNIAEKTKDMFGKLLSYGIVLSLGMQIFINISMNLGLLPIVGLPLPIMSYGGSSLVITFLSLGILLNISRTKIVF